MENHPSWRISDIAVSGILAETDSPYQYGEALTDLINKTYYRLQKNKIRNPQVLHQLIEKHANVPAFKNYLVMFYLFKGKNEKARATNHWLLKEHPDYLFGKLNLCAEYIEDEKYEEIPKVLGEFLDLGLLYPERKVFHAQELVSFTNTVCTFLIKSGDWELAENRLEVAEKVLGKDVDIIKQLRLMLETNKAINALKEFVPQMEKRREADEEPQYIPLPPQTTTAPLFKHPEIEALYTYGIEIEKTIIEGILNLPKESLIDDLETVLLDSARRFEFHMDKQSEGDWKAYPCSFLLHAIALLAALGAKEKTPLILRSLSHDGAYIDFYLGDHIFETTWQFIYQLHQDDIEPLMAFMEDPEINGTAKTILIQAISQIPMHQPERKEAVLRFYEKLIDVFLENLDNPAICDIEVVSSLVADLCHLKAERLLPKIKLLYDLDLIDGLMCGTYDSVVKDIKGRDRGLLWKNKLFNTIPELYKDILNTWSGYQEEDSRQDDYPYHDVSNPFEQPTQSKYVQQNSGITDTSKTKKSFGRKVGRNEPCPCGSGKKYKRCCWQS